MKTPIKPSKDLSFETAEGYILLNFSDIVRFEAEHNCSRVYLLHSGEPKKLRHTLNEIGEKVLSNYIFFKCHRSHIVNLKYINEFKKKSRILVTERGEIPIAKPYIKEFEEFICK
jgi:two-component system LytT family response regulator